MFSYHFENIFTFDILTSKSRLVSPSVITQAHVNILRNRNILYLLYTQIWCPLALSRCSTSLASIAFLEERTVKTPMEMHKFNMHAFFQKSVQLLADFSYLLPPCTSTPTETYVNHFGRGFRVPRGRGGPVRWRPPRAFFPPFVPSCVPRNRIFCYIFIALLVAMLHGSRGNLVYFRSGWADPYRGDTRIFR